MISGDIVRFQIREKLRVFVPDYSGWVNLWSWVVVLFTEDRRLDRDIGVQTIEGRSFRTCIKVYSIFKGEQLGANIKLTLIDLRTN
jgi:hypothetical protein